MQTEEYIPIQLTQPVRNVALSHPIYLSGQKEIGVVECQLPRRTGNITGDDYVKIADYKKFSRKYLKLVKGQPIQHKINDIFVANGYESHIEYSGDHFIANINHKYFVIISKSLAQDLGLPVKLIGNIHGQPMPEKFKTAKHRNEYLNFFQNIARKKIFRVPSGYYPSTKDIKEAFKRLGVDIDNPGNVPMMVSASLRKKLRYDQPIHAIMLHLNLIENSYVGDKSAPILRLIPFNQQPTYIFEPVQYKKMRHVNELCNLHFKVTDDRGRKVYFSHPLNLTLHIRDATV